MRGREEKVILPTATESSQTNRRLIAIARERVLTRQYKYLSSSPCVFTHSVQCIKAPIALSAHIDALILIGARNIFMTSERRIYTGG